MSVKEDVYLEQRSVKGDTYPNHQIQSQPLSMLTGLISIAPDNMGGTGVLSEDGLAGFDDVGLAVALWDLWVRGCSAALDVIGFARAVVGGRDVSCVRALRSGETLSGLVVDFARACGREGGG